MGRGVNIASASDALEKHIGPMVTTNEMISENQNNACQVTTSTYSGHNVTSSCQLTVQYNNPNVQSVTLFQDYMRTSIAILIHCNPSHKESWFLPSKFSPRSSASTLVGSQKHENKECVRKRMPSYTEHSSISILLTMTPEKQQKHKRSSCRRSRF